MSFIKKHYHWLIAALVLIQLMVYGGINNNLSLFFLPVSETFGVTRSALSLSAGVKAVASVLGTFLSGAVLLRFGYRKSVVVFLLTGILGLCVLSASDCVLIYCVGSGLWGLADGVCISAGPPRIIHSWFHHHRGTVLGAVTAATGLGGSVMSVVLSGMIESSGWKSAFLAAAVLMGIVALAMLLFVRDRPEDKGLRAFGAGQQEVGKQPKTESISGNTLRKISRSPAFYLMTVCTFASCFFSGGIMAIMIPHLQDAGLSAARAASMQSILMLVLAGVKVGCGFFSDKMGAKRVTMVCLACTGIASVLFPFAGDPAVALIAVILYSASLPLTSVMVPLLSTALFGYRSQAACLSIFMGMISLASIISSPTANVIFDKLGSYDPFFRICAVGSAALMLLYPVMYKLADKEKPVS